MRIIAFYKTIDGKCLIEEFLDYLPSKAAQKVTWVLKLLEELEIIPSKYFKKLIDTDGIWECRVKSGSDIFRLFAFFKGNEIVLTHGIVKKSQKTPPNEIDRAERYKTDYCKRMKG